jgi:hypothetical protein
MLLNALEVSIETGRSKEKIGTTWERGGEGGGFCRMNQHQPNLGHRRVLIFMESLIYIGVFSP